MYPSLVICLRLKLGIISGFYLRSLRSVNNALNKKNPGSLPGFNQNCDFPVACRPHIGVHCFASSDCSEFAFFGSNFPTLTFDRSGLRLRVYACRDKLSSTRLPDEQGPVKCGSLLFFLSGSFMELLIRIAGFSKFS